MLAYLWFCVMLRAVSPGADVIITRYNQAMEAFITAGLIGEAPASRSDQAFKSSSRSVANASAAGKAPTVHRIQGQLRQAVLSSDAWRSSSAG
jgi:hypothetical protein